MTTIDKGRFCSTCSKNVIDFSSLTDNQIIHLIENSNGALCGRLNRNQVDRIMEIQNQQSFGTIIYKLLAGLLLFFPFDNLLAQTTTKNNQTVLQTDNANKENGSIITSTNNITTKDSLKNFIKGKVFDSETKEPLAGASIIIKGKNIGTTADMNGIFTFNIPENLITDQIVFNVLYVGFEPNEFTIYKKDLPMDKEFLMLPSTTSLMGEVCVIKTKRKWWQRKKKSS
jgi:hypothetical protein